MLTLPYEPTFFIGSGLMLIGLGLVKPNITNAVGDLYLNDDTYRASGFTFFYMGMNLGAVLGPILYGIVAVTFGINYAFLVGFVGIICALIIQFHKNLGGAAILKRHKESLRLVFLSFILLVAFLSLLFSVPQASDTLLATLLVSIFAYFIFHFWRRTTIFHNILYIIVICVLAILYFAGSQQISGSITLFIARKLHTTFFNYKVPPAAFSSIKPFFIILSTPLIAVLWTKLAKKGREPSVLLKISFGLGLAGLAFFLLLQLQLPGDA